MDQSRLGFLHRFHDTFSISYYNDFQSPGPVWGNVSKQETLSHTSRYVLPDYAPDRLRLRPAYSAFEEAYPAAFEAAVSFTLHAKELLRPSANDFRASSTCDSLTWRRNDNLTDKKTGTYYILSYINNFVL